jgi:hypothetical protein
VRRRPTSSRSSARYRRNYLDWLLSNPWNKKSKINNDLVHSQQTLDHDHAGTRIVRMTRPPKTSSAWSAASPTMGLDQGRDGIRQKAHTSN